MAEDINAFLLRLAQEVGEVGGKLEALLRGFDNLRVENARDHGEIFRRLNALNGCENQRKGVREFLRTAIPYIFSAAMLAVAIAAVAVGAR